MSSKLNTLLQKWPSGTVATQAWMTEEGISPQLVQVYLKGGWIRRVGRGAYVRVGETVKWQGVVYGLQNHAKEPIWPGGETALSLYGHAHYLPLGQETVWLFGPSGKRLPAWVKEGEWRTAIKYRAPNLFGSQDEHMGSMGHLDVSAGRFDGLLLNISSMERAAFELLHYVSDEEQFTHAAEILRGLVNLRPSVMQLYLKQCRSVKTKRLVLFFGDRFKLPWYSKLDLHGIDLGSGKRQIARGGVLHQLFQITVPREFNNGT